MTPYTKGKKIAGPIRRLEGHSMKMALAQINTRIADFSGNTAKILRKTEQAVAQGADLVIFPEMATCGYPPRDLLLREDFLRANERAMAHLQARCPAGAAMLVGTICRNTISRGRKCFNSAALIHEGRVACWSHKSLLPDYDVFDETRYFEPFLAKTPCTLHGLCLGITVCEDIWYYEQGGDRAYAYDPVKVLTRCGADIIINISASPFTKEKYTERQRLIRHISHTYDVPLVYTNLVGGNDSLVFDGYSMVFHPQSGFARVLAGFAEDMTLIDTDTLDREEPARDSHHPVGAVVKALITGLGDYVRKCGFSRAIVGLSGGMDSALVAYIAARALGPENVLALSLPTAYSSQASVSDARELADNLGIAFEVIDIEPLYQSYTKQLAQAVPFRLDTTYQNLQARIRGNILMAHANRQNRILLSTGNKSETATGYATLYGDMAGGLSVISDITKTDVYRIARYINRKHTVIPQSIIDKPPSAELKPDQRDSDDLPPYDLLDKVIGLYIEEGWSVDDIVARGFDRAVVARCVALFERNEYKRRQAAPGLKITTKAFGFGRRFPLTAKSLLHDQP